MHNKSSNLITNNDKEIIQRNLQNIENDENDWDYNIYLDFEQFYEAVKVGINNKEQTQILLMCYCNNPTLKELKEWRLSQLIWYIAETDEYFKQDREYLNKICMFIGNILCDDLLNDEFLRDMENEEDADI